MDHDPPRPVTDALRLLLETCLRVAEERDDVRRSLVTLNAWLTRELDAVARGGRRARSASHGVLTPAGRGRIDGATGPGTREDGAPTRITERLVTVVTRARWKAAACRLSLDRRAHARDGQGDDAAGEQLAKRDESLRARLATLPDTSTWMLDLPFGRRIHEEGALDVADEQADRLAQVADCYDALATGAEIAIQLDEGGAFRKGPPPAFLYLLAEAQSALLQSLDGAPTRSDSDQRDVFLWLKEQTTRYRIYVDRYMRLDDPAEASGSKDLVERLRRAAREIQARIKDRRERAQLLSKVRYHVTKLGHQPLLSEVESMGAALAEWERRGLEAADRGLVEALGPARELLESGELADEVRGALDELLSGFGPSRGVRRGAQGTARRQEDGDVEDDAKAQKTLEEVRELLSARAVALCVEVGAGADGPALGDALGARRLDLIELDLAAPPDERTARLTAALEGEPELFLLGLRLDPEEYRVFKEDCLARGKQFVRLPGSLEPVAVAHQVSRQVGWRLRTQERQAGS